MPEFKELERVFWESVEASALQPPGPPDNAPTARQEGFGEAPGAFSYSDSSSAIDASEAACLSYEVKNGEELQAKVEFIVQLMRRLTDETDEFDAYADRLRADVASFIFKVK